MRERELASRAEGNAETRFPRSFLISRYNEGYSRDNRPSYGSPSYLGLSWLVGKDGN